MHTTASAFSRLNLRELFLRSFVCFETHFFVQEKLIRHFSLIPERLLYIDRVKNEFMENIP